MNVDFRAAHAKLARDVPGFCAHYLPGGAIRGDWYLVRVPWRQDRTPSLGVSMTTGFWKDFGRHEGGDLPGLIARLEHRSPVDVARAVLGTG